MNILIEDLKPFQNILGISKEVERYKTKNEEVIEGLKVVIVIKTTTIHLLEMLSPYNIFSSLFCSINNQYIYTKSKL